MPKKYPNKKRVELINVTTGQLEYELAHLKIKLAKRDAARLKDIEKIKKPLPHPLFKPVKGKAETWEIIKS